jgi:hypothetical protein
MNRINLEFTHFNRALNKYINDVDKNKGFDPKYANKQLDQTKCAELLRSYPYYIFFIIISLCDQYFSPKIEGSIGVTFEDFLNENKFDIHLINKFNTSHTVTGWEHHVVCVVKDDNTYAICNSYLEKIYTIGYPTNPICVVSPVLPSKDKIVLEYENGGEYVPQAKTRRDFYFYSNLFPNIIMDASRKYLYIYGILNRLNAQYTIFNTYKNADIKDRHILLHVYNKTRNKLFQYTSSHFTSATQPNKIMRALEGMSEETILRIFRIENRDGLFELEFDTETKIQVVMEDITGTIVYKKTEWDGTKDKDTFLYDLVDGTFQYPCNINTLQKGGSCTVFSRFYAFLYLYIKHHRIIDTKTHEFEQMKIYTKLQEWSFQYFTYYSNMYINCPEFYRDDKKTNPLMDIAFYAAISTGLVNIIGSAEDEYYDTQESLRYKWWTVLKRTKQNYKIKQIETFTETKMRDVVQHNILEYFRVIYSKSYSLPEIYFLSCIPHNEFSLYAENIDLVEFYEQAKSIPHRTFFYLSVYHRLLYTKYPTYFTNTNYKQLRLFPLSDLSFLPIESICVHETTEDAHQLCSSYFCAELFPNLFILEKNKIGDKNAYRFEISFRNIHKTIPNRKDICRNLFFFHTKSLHILPGLGYSFAPVQPEQTMEYDTVIVSDKDGYVEYTDCFQSFNMSSFFPVVYNMPNVCRVDLFKLKVFYNDFLYASKRCKWYNSMFQNDNEVPFIMQTQLNIYKNRNITNGLGRNIYCSRNTKNMLGILTANIINEEDTEEYQIKVEQHYAEWAIYTYIRGEKEMFSRLEEFQKQRGDVLSAYYNIIGNTYSPRKIYILPTLTLANNIFITTKRAQLIFRNSKFLIFKYPNNIEEYIFLEIECINLPGHFLHLTRFDRKWYTSLERTKQVHVENIDQIDTHEFSWNLFFHPVTISPNKVQSYLIIRPSEHIIPLSNTQPVRCKDLKLKYISKREKYIYTYINIHKNALICDTKIDLELVTMCTIEHKRHDVYARLYPQLHCFIGVYYELLNGVLSNFPFAYMENKKPKLNVERAGYNDWEFPIFFLEQNLLPNDLQIKISNKEHNFDIYKEVLEYGLEDIKMQENQELLLRDIIREDKKYTFVQRVMGAGKTSVLLPFLALYYMFQRLIGGEQNAGGIFTLMIVPYPQLVEQVFRRFLHAMGWTGIVQVQIRTEMVASNYLYIFPNRRPQIPLVLICTDAWVKYQILTGAFNDERNRPTVVLVDEYDEVSDPYRSLFILFKHVPHGQNLEEVFLRSTEQLRDHIGILNIYRQRGYDRTECNNQIIRFRNSNNFVWAAWYIAVQELSNLTYLLHFGLHPKKLFAVPYIAQGLYSENEDFEDPMFRAVATLYCVLQNGTTPTQNKIYLQYFQNKNEKKENVPRVWQNIYSSVQLSIDAKYMNLQSLTDIEDIHMFTKNIILHNTELSGKNTICTTPHMFMHSKQGLMRRHTKVIAMSGTLSIDDIPTTIHEESHIITDPEWERVSKLLHTSLKIEVDDNPPTMRSYLLAMNAHIIERSRNPRNKNYRHHAYIDIGATNLTYDSEAVGDVYKTIQRIVHFELQNQSYTHVIYPGEGNEPYIYEIESQNSLRYDNRAPSETDKWFYYFGQPYCRGFDVRTIFENIIVPILGFVAISKDNTFNEVAQAAFRLRHLLITPRMQEIILIFPKGVNGIYNLENKQRQQNASRKELLKKHIATTIQDNKTNKYIEEKMIDIWFINHSNQVCIDKINTYLQNSNTIRLPEKHIQNEINVNVNVNIQRVDSSIGILNTSIHFPDRKHFDISYNGSKTSDTQSVYLVDVTKNPSLYIGNVWENDNNNFFVLCPNLREFELNLIFRYFRHFYDVVLNGFSSINKYVGLYWVLYLYIKKYNIQDFQPILTHTSLVTNDDKNVFLSIENIQTDIISRSGNPTYLNIETFLADISPRLKVNMVSK